MFTDLCLLYLCIELTNRVLSLSGVDGGRSPEATELRDRTRLQKILMRFIFLVSFIDSKLPVTLPSTFKTPRPSCGFNRGEHLYATMRPVMVIEWNGTSHCLDHLLNIVEDHALKELVFEGVFILSASGLSLELPDSVMLMRIRYWCRTSI